MLLDDYPSSAGDSMILVTGGAGFIDSRLRARLVSLGLDVVAVDDYVEGSRAIMSPECIISKGIPATSRA
jgi:UDP-glucose 4-epimerase